MSSDSLIPVDTLRVRLLLSLVALAMLTMMVFLVLLSRVGNVIAVEVDRAQGDYLRSSAAQPGALKNALQLGHCVRRRMQTSASHGILNAEWAPLERAKADVACQAELKLAPPLAANLGAK